MQAFDSYKEKDGFEQNKRFLNSTLQIRRWVAFLPVFLIVLDMLTDDNVKFRTYIKEEGVWLHLVEVVSNLKAYIIFSFWEERQTRWRNPKSALLDKGFFERYTMQCCRLLGARWSRDTNSLWSTHLLSLAY